MTTDRKDELPLRPWCPWCQRAIMPRQTRLATPEGLLHFGCEREMRIARKRRSEGRHTEADRLALARVEPDTKEAPCTDDGTTDGSTSATGGGTTGTSAITAFGCFRDHPSHTNEAEQWQCIREHFAELTAKAEHWHTWERFGRVAQPVLDAADVFVTSRRRTWNRSDVGIIAAEHDLGVAVDAYREAMHDV